MPTKTKTSSKRNAAARSSLARGSALRVFKPGTVLQYLYNGITAYRIQVVRQIGRVIFAHSVFTTGKVQRCGQLQVLDLDGLDSVTVEKQGQPWEQKHPRNTYS